MAEELSAPASAREPTRRLFFALWPDEAMRQAMMQATRKAAHASGGRLVSAGNLHVTLAFLGSVPERRRVELAGVAREAAAETRGGPARAGASRSGNALELRFDRLEHWRAARLLCAVPRVAPEWIEALAGKFQELLARRGFGHDLESSASIGIEVIGRFRPHVTLARKAHRLPGVMEMDTVMWSIADFVLVDSKTLPGGSVYTVLERFPLGY